VNIPYGHPAWIEIDLHQFKQNIYIIRDWVGKRLLCLPVKSNAYGHGLIPIARAAMQAGVDYLAVSCLQEGALLRQAGISLPIMVLGAIHEAQVAELLQYDLECTVASFLKAELLSRQCLLLQKKCKVHLEVDTGMQRTGVRTETAIKLLEFLLNSHAFEIVGIYSHFATADEPNNSFANAQINEFKEFIDKCCPKNKNIICSLANSGGVCYYPESYLDMVRPGLLCFGVYPDDAQQQPKGIRSILSLKAKISYFKTVTKDSGISYGHTYRTSQDSRVVTVPVGYGDGYRRALSNCGPVLIRGKRYAVSGSICMDQFMVDIGQTEAYVGDIVTLIGKDGEQEVTIQELSQLCNTIPYEILCGFNNRQPRLYKDKENLRWDYTTLPYNFAEAYMTL
jgi:alanine racemase